MSNDADSEQLRVNKMLTSTGVLSFPSFQASVPNGHVNGQNTGHGDNSTFRWAFSGVGYAWTTALCNLDSDGDGQSNGLELGDPCCIWEQGSVPTFTSDISVAGDPSSMTSRVMPSCDRAVAQVPAKSPHAFATFAVGIGILMCLTFRLWHRASGEETARRFLDAFLASDTSFQVSGLCGRFIRGVNEEQLAMLSDEPGKLLSWLCGEELLQSVIGKDPVAAMVQIGFGLDWIRARLDDGTKFRLVAFPASEETSTTLATWDGLWTLIRMYYGEAVADRLTPHMASLKRVTYEAIDPMRRLREVSNLPVADKLSHPEYMTVERFLALEDEQVTLYQARAFFYHAVGCNMLFRGDGTNNEGKAEFVTPNRCLKDIPGAMWLDLEVSVHEINDLLARKPPQITGGDSPAAWAATKNK